LRIAAGYFLLRNDLNNCLFMEPYFIAQVCLFGGNFAPSSWMFCAGQLVSIAENSALFSLIGTTYGGDGQVTFGLPDFRGRIPVGAGQGPGLSPIVIGQQEGTQSITITQNQMPAHTHVAAAAVGASSQAGNTGNPANAVVSGAPAAFYTSASQANGSFTGTVATIQPAGNSQPISNMMPYTGINFIIALEGIFPARN
jgi:microcystin-dependent protein